MKKLKTFSTMALSLLIGGATLVGDAKGRTRSVAFPKAADLEAMVQIFEDQEGQKPIPNGAQVFDKPFVWARFTVSNKGLAKADRFTFKAVIYQNGAKAMDPAAETITLEANQTKALPMMKMDTLGRSEQISARMIADLGNFVKETNESNNKMEMSFQIANNF